MQEQWKQNERKAALLTLAAPLLVAIATAFTLTPILSTDALLFTPFIALAAYASLLLFVLPTLKLLQRFSPLKRASFSATVAAAGTTPWFVLYMEFFGSTGSAKYGGAPGHIMLLLVPPLVASFLVSYLIHPHIRQDNPK